jgi:AraC-like DNA-binding protein
MPTDSYHESAPAAPLAPAVSRLWTRTAGVAGVARVVPDGCTDVIFGVGGGNGLQVAGPDTVAHVTRPPAGTIVVGVRFRPGAGPAVLGAPGDELRDGRVPLDALWPAAEVRRLADRIGEAVDRAGDPAAGLAPLAAAVGRRLADAAPDPAAAVVSELMAKGASVPDAAAAVGLGERQLHRRCLAWFGYGPKVLQRVLRFQRAVRLAERGLGYADVAAAIGYADQAHLARDVRALSGVTLAELLSARTPAT